MYSYQACISILSIYKFCQVILCGLKHLAWPVGIGKRWGMRSFARLSPILTVFSAPFIYGIETRTRPSGRLHIILTWAHSMQRKQCVFQHLECSSFGLMHWLVGVLCPISGMILAMWDAHVMDMGSLSLYYHFLEPKTGGDMWCDSRTLGFWISW